MHSAEFILYVTDQARARDFYAAVLRQPPILDMPGMTEFDLGGATLGLMPAGDMLHMLGARLDARGGQRCEVYLRRDDAPHAVRRALAAGGRLLSPREPRPWGETVAYQLDPDGHVLAFADAGP